MAVLASLLSGGFRGGVYEVIEGESDYEGCRLCRWARSTPMMTPVLPTAQRSREQLADPELIRATSMPDIAGSRATADPSRSPKCAG